MPGVDDLAYDDVREALRLLGEDVPSAAAAVKRRLRDTLTGYGTVRALIDQAPDGAREAFVRLVEEGCAPVEDLLGRGWWGHGTLPPPLDWLQRRALILVGTDGRVYPSAEAARGFSDLTLTLDAPAAASDTEPLRVEAVRTVVVAPRSELLDRALAVTQAGLRAVAATVAVSDKAEGAVRAALRAAGVDVEEASVVRAEPGAPALPGTDEEAVGPRSVRALLTRAIDEGRQVRLEYFPSSRGGAATDRVVDPWSFGDDLLRGYCHLRAGERTFAVDRIGRARLLAHQVEHPAP